MGVPKASLIQRLVKKASLFDSLTADSLYEVTC